MLHTPASPIPFDPQSIAEILHTATADWHETLNRLPEDASILSLALRLHRANFDLWHQEDLARDPRASDAAIVRTKRAIDQINQHRNDLAEQIDHILLQAVAPTPEGAPLHSETPGMMLDRLSILSLKRFHTSEQIGRTDVDEEHRAVNRVRLGQLDQQFADLATCLDLLWSEVLRGTRRFKLYRQHKMYNDPTLNPVLYKSVKP